MTNKWDIFPGARVEVVKASMPGLGFSVIRFALNEDNPFGKPGPVPLNQGDELEVLTYARKLDRINLVRVRRVSDNQIGEVFFKNVRYNTRKS